MNNKKALLVIDMQKGSFTPQTLRFDTTGVVMRINELAKTLRGVGQTVIFIQHDGSKEGAFVPHTSDWGLLPELEVSKDDLILGKTANDAFYESDLKSRLDELKISELLITGCATDFCVEATIQSALAKDYLITVVKDAHTTADRPHIEAAKVIEHYNWTWQCMIPTRGKIEVKDFEEIKKDLE